MSKRLDKQGIWTPVGKADDSGLFFTVKYDQTVTSIYQKFGQVVEIAGKITITNTILPGNS